MKGIEEYSAQQIADLVKSISPNDLQKEISRMAPEQISAVIATLQPFEEKDWREKLTAIYSGLDQRPLLEAAGLLLTPSQALTFLDISHECDPKQQWKLSPLFVGMTHETFMNLLAICDDDQYHTLQHEALTEGLQHHLTVLAHDLQKCDLQLHQTIDQLTNEIDNIDPIILTSAMIRSLLDRIESLQDTYNRLIEINNRALGLAWNTNRSDLVDNLNTAKESLIRVCNQEIGLPRNGTTPASGIYAHFDQHLNSIYGDATDSTDIEALHDDEPPIEAMTKLSIWYIKDYWQLGLLPTIKSESQLRLDPTTHSEKQCMEHREKLLNEIYKNLEQMGLSTVADFKAAQIYSKEMLTEYIDKRRHLVTSTQKVQR